MYEPISTFEARGIPPWAEIHRSAKHLIGSFREQEFIIEAMILRVQCPIIRVWDGFTNHVLEDPPQESGKVWSSNQESGSQAVPVKN